VKNIFLPDQRYEGVRPINIYLLRLLYILMFFVLGKETWTHILTHQGPWDPIDAVAWCVWAAFGRIGNRPPIENIADRAAGNLLQTAGAGFGGISALVKGNDGGPPAEGITSQFLWVFLPIVAVPWGYAFANYVYKPKN
jgi:hypothetical protein